MEDHMPTLNSRNFNIDKSPFKSGSYLGYFKVYGEEDEDAMKAWLTNNLEGSNWSLMNGVVEGEIWFACDQHNATKLALLFPRDETAE
jgi:hypothetical protein